MTYVDKSKFAYKFGKDAQGLPSESLDMSLMYYMVNGHHYEYYHRLIYADFVQNHPNYNSIEALLAEHPNTFLVHGKEWYPRYHDELDDDIEKLYP